MSTPQTKQIGQILLEKGFITRPHLKYALALQMTVKKKKQIGKILLDLGYITKSELNEAIAIQRKTKKTGKTKVLHHV